VVWILDFHSDKIRFEIEAEKRLQLENNERMARMAAAEKERQLAEQRKVAHKTYITISTILAMPVNEGFVFLHINLTVRMKRCAVKTRSTGCA
jgi:hypothetical protein